MASFFSLLFPELGGFPEEWAAALDSGPFGLELMSWEKHGPESLFGRPPWLERDDDGSWRALDMVDGEPWLVRLYRHPDTRLIYRVSFEHFRDPGAEPTPTTLRKIHLGQIKDAIASWVTEGARRRAALRKWTGRDDLGRDLDQIDLGPQATHSRRGRPPLDERYLRGLALALLERQAEGERAPVQRLCDAVRKHPPDDRYSTADETIRSHLTQAVEKGYLTAGRRRGAGPRLFAAPAPPRVGGPTGVSGFGANLVETIVRGVVGECAPQANPDAALERRIGDLHAADIQPSAVFARITSDHKTLLVLEPACAILDELGLPLEDASVESAFKDQLDALSEWLD